MTEDKMVGWHHRLNGHEFEQALGDGEGQGSLPCCSPWGCKELGMTEQLNNATALYYVHWDTWQFCRFDLRSDATIHFLTPEGNRMKVSQRDWFSFMYPLTDSVYIYWAPTFWDYTEWGLLLWMQPVSQISYLNPKGRKMPPSLLELNTQNKRWSLL